jgi:hypothetical protein
VLGLSAAARGALLLADGQSGLGGCARPTVSVPVHEIRAGLLAEANVPLPWTSSFACGDEPLRLEQPELTLDIGPRRVAIALPELPAGHYGAAVRPSWSGGGVLVLRAERAAGRFPALPAASRVTNVPGGAGVRVIPLPAPADPAAPSEAEGAAS